MEPREFDDWIRQFPSFASRRAVVRALAGGAIGGALGLLGLGEAAAVCRNPGETCRRAGQCCSGKCRNGKCRAVPGQCTAEKALCLEGGNPNAACDANGEFTCTCRVKVSGAAFCATAYGGDVCYHCTSDEDCQQAFGSDAFACVKYNQGACTCPNGIKTACIARCPNPA